MCEDGSKCHFCPKGVWGNLRSARFATDFYDIKNIWRMRLSLSHSAMETTSRQKEAFSPLTTLHLCLCNAELSRDVQGNLKLEAVRHKFSVFGDLSGMRLSLSQACSTKTVTKIWENRGKRTIPIHRHDEAVSTVKTLQRMCFVLRMILSIRKLMNNFLHKLWIIFFVLQRISSYCEEKMLCNTYA